MCRNSNRCRNAIAAARISGIVDDLNLSDSEFQLCVSILFIGSVDYTNTVLPTKNTDLLQLHPNAGPIEHVPQQDRPSFVISSWLHDHLGMSALSRVSMVLKLTCFA